MEYGLAIRDMVYRYGYLPSEMVILDINMGYALMIWEMTISIWSSWISIWNILSPCRRAGVGGKGDGSRGGRPATKGLHSFTSQLNLSRS